MKYLPKSHIVDAGKNFILIAFHHPVSKQINQSAAQPEQAIVQAKGHLVGYILKLIIQQGIRPLFHLLISIFPCQCVTSDNTAHVVIADVGLGHRFLTG